MRDPLDLPGLSRPPDLSDQAQSKPRRSDPWDQPLRLHPRDRWDRSRLLRPKDRWDLPYPQGQSDPQDLSRPPRPQDPSRLARPRGRSDRSDLSQSQPDPSDRSVPWDRALLTPAR